MATETDSRGSRNLYSLDKYIVVSKLSLRYCGSSGVRNPVGTDILQLTGQSLVLTGRWLHNFAGSVHLSTGRKPVFGEPCVVFAAMRLDAECRQTVLSDARERLQTLQVEGRRKGIPSHADPESLDVEGTDVALPTPTRRLVRAEAQRVRRRRTWLGTRGLGAEAELFRLQVAHCAPTTPTFKCTS